MEIHNTEELSYINKKIDMIGVNNRNFCLLYTSYMGKTDVERQHINVEKMKMLGATVIPVTSGNMTLKDATNEAIRDWC